MRKGGGDNRKDAKCAKVKDDNFHVLEVIALHSLRPCGEKKDNLKVAKCGKVEWILAVQP